MLIIEADMVVAGQLTVVGTVRLEGRYEGTITCTRLEIGRDGYLLGSAAVEDLVVAGQIVGQVTARTVHLEATAIVEGELAHQQLRMDEAATLVGESRRERSHVMPHAFLDLAAKVRSQDEDYDNQQVETRVRLVEQAERLMPQFKKLRAKFPALTR
jgi:cytoskeletal protein CcmA (bactofilin family)